MLKKLADSYVECNVALICFDFPAHGESPVGEEMLTVENCKKDLLAVAEYVSEKYPDADKSIFATSFGGYITLLCAELLKDFAFVLRAPAVTMPVVLLENVLKISAEAFKEQGCVCCGFERPIDLPYSFYENLLEQRNACDVCLSQRTLVIHGDRDDIVPLSDVKAFVKNQDTVTLEIIRGADHRFKNKGEAEKVTEYTGGFLNIQPC